MSKRLEDVIPLIGAFASTANSLDRGRLTKLRLVKFLYLLDVYFAQSTSQLFTGWSWAFVHYGPYCRESTDAIDLAETKGFLESISYESKYKDEDFRLYGPGANASEERTESAFQSLPPHVSYCLQSAIRRWYDDTYDLLDYVYFRTAPMRGVKPGATLSFDSVRMPDFSGLRPIKLGKIDDAVKKKLQGAIANLTARESQRRVDWSPVDEDFISFSDEMAGPETPFGWDGTAELRFVEPDDD